MHSPFWFVHLTHQNLIARALFCHNSLTKVNTELLICKFYIYVNTLNIKATLIFQNALHYISGLQDFIGQGNFSDFEKATQLWTKERKI